jgi:hypothetical protein
MFRINRLSIVLSLTLAAVAAAPSVALADAPAATPHVSAPKVTAQARFQRYLLAPNGHVMGLLMQDGSVVRLSHQGMQPDAPALQTGDALQVEGRALKTATGTFYVRALVSKDSKVIADGRHHEKSADGEKGKRHRGQKQALQNVSAKGRVAAVITNPRGGVMAVVLDDGTTAIGSHMETLGLKVGDAIAVAGKGGAYAQGKALRIEKITMPDGTTRDLPKPEHHHRQKQAPTNAPA